jgi:hypothetical protein
MTRRVISFTVAISNSLSQSAMAISGTLWGTVRIVKLGIAPNRDSNIVMIESCHSVALSLNFKGARKECALNILIMKFLPEKGEREDMVLEI